MKLFIGLLLAATLFSLWEEASGSKGVDVSTAVSKTAFSCLKQEGYELVIVRAYRSSGFPDRAATGNILNARAGGFQEVDLYMFPCPKCSQSASSQVQDMGRWLYTVYSWKG